MANVAKKAKRVFDFIVVNPTKYALGVARDVVHGVADRTEEFTNEQISAAKDVVSKQQ